MNFIDKDHKFLVPFSDNDSSSIKYHDIPAIVKDRSQFIYTVSSMVAYSQPK